MFVLEEIRRAASAFFHFFFFAVIFNVVFTPPFLYIYRMVLVSSCLLSLHFCWGLEDLFSLQCTLYKLKSVAKLGKAYNTFLLLVFFHSWRWLQEVIDFLMKSKKTEGNVYPGSSVVSITITGHIVCSVPSCIWRDVRICVSSGFWLVGDHKWMKLFFKGCL